jgi:hypothetical protein
MERKGLVVDGFAIGQTNLLELDEAQGLVQLR